MKWANCWKVAAVVLSVFCPIMSMAGYLGEDWQKDPDKVVFILPDNAHKQYDDRLKRAKVVIYFDHPVSVVSLMNLNTGDHQGYHFSGPEPSILGPQWFVTVQFDNYPVPVVIATHFDRRDSRSCPAVNDYMFEESYLSVGDRVVRLNEQGLPSGDQRNQYQGLVLIDVATHMGFCNANLYTLSIDARHQVFTRTVIKTSTPDLAVQNYRQGLSVPQSLVAVDLNAAFHGKRSLSGVNQRFFQHVWFEHGIPDNLITLLLSATGRSGSIRDVLIRGLLPPRGYIRARYYAWYQLMEHLQNAEQNTAVQFLGLLSQPYDEIPGKIQEIINSNNDIADVLSATLGPGGIAPSYILDRNGQLIHQHTNPVTKHTFTVVPNSSVLGEGGEGSVYLVTDEEGRERALKVFRVLDERSTKHMERLSEIMKKNMLKSGHIVKPLEQWTDGQTLYQVMNYYPDGDLNRLMTERPDYIRSHKDLIIFQMVLAVTWLHVNNIVHRDIKPENFLVSMSQNRVLLHDLGMVREMSNPDQMAESIFITPSMLGPNSAKAIHEDRPYKPYIMDWESLALSLVPVATGGTYLFSDSTELFENFYDRTGNQVYLLQRLKKGITEKTLPHRRKQILKKNIIDELKSQMSPNESIPDHLLDFIADLMDIDPNKKVDAMRLSTMLSEYDFFQPFIKSSPEAIELLQSLKKQSDSNFQQIKQELPGHLTPQYVEKDGNCLPAAIAGAYNHQNPGARWRQEDVRQKLINQLNKILKFISDLANHSIQIVGVTAEGARVLSGQFLELLIQITGIDEASLESVRWTSSEQGTGWMDSGLIALLPLLQIDVNLYSLRGAVSLNEPMIQYNRAFWHNNAPFLMYYLVEQGIIDSGENTITINLVHNGADNNTNGGHYYYATENRTFGQEDNNRAAEGFEFIPHGNTGCQRGCRPAGDTVTRQY